MRTMNDDRPDEPIGDLIGRLAQIDHDLRSPALKEQLQGIDTGRGSALVRGLLRLGAFLDDSVSNPHLGSVFDRAEASPLNAMLRNVARSYGVAATVAGTGGTSALNAPAVMALAGEGESILVGRECHVSVYGGLSLSGAVPHYLVPAFDPDLGVSLPATPDEVEAELRRYPEIRAAVLTLPTYHGLTGRLDAIVEVCRRRGVILMIDEAHGPHLHFLASLGFPRAAEDAGADLITQSTHKLLSAINQASVAHFNNAALLPRFLECQAMGFQSTSFSYPILLSLEYAVDQMVHDGEQRWAGARQQAERLRDGAAALRGVRVLDDDIVDGVRVAGLDPTRVTLNIRDTGHTGYQVAEALLAGFGILVELATPDVILFLVSPGVEAAEVDATLEGLGAILAGAVPVAPTDPFAPPTPPRHVLTPRRAMVEWRRRRIPAADAIGRVSAETIGCYPPGWPILVAGERITPEAVTYLRRAAEAGGHLKRGVQEHPFRTIEVIDMPCTPGDELLPESPGVTLLL